MIENDLPKLNILDVIDISEFEQNGDEFVGPHPILGPSVTLYVNPVSDSWHFAYPNGDDVGGDAWLWLLCEMGTVEWQFAGPRQMNISCMVEYAKRESIKRGLFSREELFPRTNIEEIEEPPFPDDCSSQYDYEEEPSSGDEEDDGKEQFPEKMAPIDSPIGAPNDSPIIYALERVKKICVDAQNDRFLPYKNTSLIDLILVKERDPETWEKTKVNLKASGIKITDLEKAMKAYQKNMLKQSKESKIQEAEKESKYHYIVIDEKGKMTLLISNLVDDIIKDLNIRILSKTKDGIGIYNPDTGTFAIGDYGWRKINHEVGSRVRESGDDNVSTLSPSTFKKIEILIKSHAPEVSGDVFESRTSLLCVGNGVVDLKTSALMPYDPKYCMVEKTSTMFDDSGEWQYQAPGWKSALETVFDNDIEKMNFFQRAMGYCITGETVLDAIFLLLGIGGTGKSTILDAIRHAMSNDASSEGGYIKPLKADLQAGKASSGAARDGIVKAQYARMLIVKELDEQNAVSWGTIKEMCSSSSMIEARELYKGTKMIKLLAKMVFDTNHMPICETPDRSILRRLKIIPFRHLFDERTKDTNTFKNLMDENIGILHWLVDGARMYYEAGLGAPAFLDDELEIYKDDMDSFLITAWFESSGFVIDVSHPKLESEHWLKSEDIYVGYAKFAHESGLVKPADSNKVISFLKNRGAIKQIKEKDGKRSRFWLNIIQT